MIAEVEQLEIENARLHAQIDGLNMAITTLKDELKHMTKERDAAVLEVCKHCPDGEIVDRLKYYPCDVCKWRGPVAGEGQYDESV